ncbi:MAG: hypothetical protein RIC16_02185 [Rhodospirillales bacterium]
MITKLSFLTVKGVPALPWSSAEPLNLRPRMTTVAYLVAGLTLFGLGETLILTANAGLSPWIVLAEGTGNVTGWSVGFATFAISVAVLVLWVPLHQKPGIGTILNAVIIAAVIEFAAPYLPSPENYPLRLLQTTVGIYIVGFGGAMYLIANLGPGPRDGLMTGLQRITGAPIAWVRSSIEVTVVIAGWLLGGTVGVGTVMFALMIGPAVAMNLYLLAKLFGCAEIRQAGTR